MSDVPSHSDEEQEIRADARREKRLVLQGGIALAVVVVIVIVRELLL